MELEKILESDLAGKGVIGQPDVPGLPPEEMQKKVEEIVREIAIPKINEIIEYIAGKVATQEDLEKLLIEAGSVTSVFGRAGAVKAMAGDYTAEMVGAAAVKHAEQHGTNGSDPIKPEKIGAAAEKHAHGNISSEGTIGDQNGKIVVTGLNGKLEAKEKSEVGFILPAVIKNITGAFTAENNVFYEGNGISDFVFNCDSEKLASCHGFLTFGTPGTISMSGFDFIDDPDGISTAKAGSRWEFDLERGCLLIAKRSE
jgi:hypothetical protein